ncbi:MAG: tetratricopeptide repeat protein [Limisphaerales bacterium]
MAENRIDPRKNFVPRVLPWLLAAAAFVIYCITLNRWVSLLNLAVVAKISGWTWQPEVLNPISFLVTFPFRWLPTAAIPIALNLFSALCAAVTLGLLARSVAILPQDRVTAQRERERSAFSFLTIRNAWLPPVFAVFICGLQMTFWENATNQAGAMFDLLIFAFVVWSLLEYRLDEREGRLFLAAFVYGVGMTDDWALVGFFPLFIAAIVWTRKRDFFNLRFLSRMTLYGVAGLLFYFLLPLLAILSHKMPATFWQTLKYNLGQQWSVVKLFFVQPQVRRVVGELSLTSLLPVFVMAIRWKSDMGGDVNWIAMRLKSVMFHLINAVILVACVWVAFDPPFSPRNLGFGIPFLTFYYLGALSIGYFSGYFLLVFGKRAASSRSSHRPKPSPFAILNPAVMGGVWLLAAFAAAILIYKNTPQILRENDGTLEKFASLMEEKLPDKGGILLADDPRELTLTQSALARDGRLKDFVPLETQSLPYPPYHEFLHRKFPNKWPELPASIASTNTLNPIGLIVLLAKLAKTNELYYLQPSFGYYFEQFYMEPHGLVYKLITLPNDTLLPPLPDKKQIVENENFWAQAEKEFSPIENMIAPPAPGASKSFGNRVLARLHLERETNQNAVAAGDSYSRALDFWGVELQRAGDLTNAAAQFETALKLNPDNISAQVNLGFNEKLRAGQSAPLDLSKTSPDQLGKPMNQALSQDGPFDEPSFCFEDAYALVQNYFLRQAVEPFERVRQLVPDNAAARFWLAQIYIRSQLPNRALDVLRGPLADPEKFSIAETNQTQLNVLAAAAYFQKNETARGTQLLQTEISRHPTNDDLLIAAAKTYLVHGLFTNALDVINHKLKSTPDDPDWLFGKGYVLLEMKNYDPAISTLSRVLSMQPTNYNALFNRAVAYLDSSNLDAAHTDYEKLQRAYTNSPQAAYGLGEIAWRKHETNAAIKNYQIYLANANTNTAEAKKIATRLRELKK